MKTGLIFVLALMLIATSSISADDDPETPWPVEERCVTAPSQPPDDWTFEGTIITTGWAGIHGMNAAWDTPHVLAFNDRWIVDGGFGTLSPDGRWYAVPQATFRPDSIYGGYADVTRLLIYDLKNSRTVLHIEWNDSYELFFGSGASRYYTFRTPVWFDQDTIIYQRGERYYFIHVPELEIEEWVAPVDWQGVSLAWVYISHPSPDWSRIVARLGGFGLFNTETNEIIAVVYRATANIDLPMVAWLPNSNEFIVSGALSTTLYDVDGNLLEVISSASQDEANNYTNIRENAYSPDGSLFWLSVNPEGPSYSGVRYLGVAARAESTILNTCLDSHVSAQFSPDGRYIALLSYMPGLQELQILDLSNWQLYSTGIYHNGTIIGWRED